MKDLLNQMKAERERAYKAYMSAELEEEEKHLAYFDGVLSGMDIIINLVEKSIEDNKE